MLTPVKSVIIALLLFGLVLALSGIVWADQGVRAVPETQTITTGTTFIADGLVTENDALAWTLSNQSIVAIPPLDENQIVYTTAYDANVVAQAGKTTLVKTMAVDTRNKVVSQSNVKADTGTTFILTADGGNIAGSENLLIDGTADLTENAEDSILCPFASGPNGIIPAYCNIVQAGSKYDLTVGSVTTSANDKFVSNDAGLPVTLNYNINVKPYGTSQGQVPSTGSAMAYLKAHLQEARGWDENLPDEGMNKSEDVTYSETSSAQGTISTFDKEMSYSSQITSSLAVNHIIHASVAGAIGVTGDGITTAYIIPMGDIQVPDHSSATFTMGTHHIVLDQFSNGAGTANVYVDGVYAGDINSYVFQDVTSDHTIVARPGGA